MSYSATVVAISFSDHINVRTERHAQFHASARLLRIPSRGRCNVMTERESLHSRRHFASRRTNAMWLQFAKYTMAAICKGTGVVWSMLIMVVICFLCNVITILFREQIQCDHSFRFLSGYSVGAMSLRNTVTALLARWICNVIADVVTNVIFRWLTFLSEV